MWKGEIIMVPFKSIGKKDPIEKVIIHSLDLALYQVSIVCGGVEELVMDNRNRPVRARNTLELEALFEGYDVREMCLRHESAYDEMVNQPVREGSNRIEVPLGRNGLGYAANDS